jgi:hypothetical protein
MLFIYEDFWLGIAREENIAVLRHSLGKTVIAVYSRRSNDLALGFGRRWAFVPHHYVRYPVAITCIGLSEFATGPQQRTDGKSLLGRVVI